MASSGESASEAISDVSCSPPTRTVMTGKHVRLHPMQADHADQLFESIAGKGNEALYTYLAYGPFDNLEAFREHIAAFAASEDVHFYTIENLQTGKLVGQISYLRITPSNRVIEIGHVLYGPSLRRTVGATEAFYLMARKVFEEGYRRLEWKCNNANRASYRAAIRLGHTFEGVFRQHMIVKGLNRDSAWFSILDQEWPSRKDSIEKWMRDDNFDENGQQRKDLATFLTRAEQEAS